MPSEFKKWKYDGPIYYYGNKITVKSELYTMAKTYIQARNNILHKIADGDYISRYDIVDDHLKEIKNRKDFSIQAKIPQYCPICKGILSDSGKCDCGYNINDDDI